MMTVDYLRKALKQDIQDANEKGKIVSGPTERLNKAVADAVTILDLQAVGHALTDEIARMRRLYGPTPDPRWASQREA